MCNIDSYETLIEDDTKNMQKEMFLCCNILIVSVA